MLQYYFCMSFSSVAPWSPQARSVDCLHRLNGSPLDISVRTWSEGGRRGRRPSGPAQRGLRALVLRGRSPRDKSDLQARIRDSHRGVVDATESSIGWTGKVGGSGSPHPGREAGALRRVFEEWIRTIRQYAARTRSAL